MFDNDIAAKVTTAPWQQSVHEASGAGRDAKIIGDGARVSEEIDPHSP